MNGTYRCLRLWCVGKLVIVSIWLELRSNSLNEGVESNKDGDKLTTSLWGLK